MKDKISKLIDGVVRKHEIFFQMAVTYSSSAAVVEHGNCDCRCSLWEGLVALWNSEKSTRRRKSLTAVVDEARSRGYRVDAISEKECSITVSGTVFRLNYGGQRRSVRPASGTLPVSPGAVLTVDAADVLDAMEAYSSALPVMFGKIEECMLQYRKKIDIVRISRPSIECGAREILLPKGVKYYFPGTYDCVRICFNVAGSTWISCDLDLQDYREKVSLIPYVISRPYDYRVLGPTVRPEQDCTGRLDAEWKQYFSRTAED